MKPPEIELPAELVSSARMPAPPAAPTVRVAAPFSAREAPVCKVRLLIAAEDESEVAQVERPTFDVLPAVMLEASSEEVRTWKPAPLT